MQIYNHLTKVKQLVRHLKSRLMFYMLNLTRDLVLNPGHRLAETWIQHNQVDSIISGKLGKYNANYILMLKIINTKQYKML